MRKRQPKREMTLMTLLANEASKDSRELLKRHKRPDAKSYTDLEVKLAELYTATPDKFTLEKEMAAIHPHKNWLVKTLELDKPKEIEVQKKTMEVESVKPNVACCGNPYCPVHGCMGMGAYSNFNQTAKFDINSPDYKPNQSDTPKFNPESEFDKAKSGHIALVGIIAIFGMTLFVLTQYKK